MKVLKLIVLLVVCSYMSNFVKAGAAQPTTNFYRITPRSQAGMAFDMFGMSNSNGSAVYIWPWNAGPNQQWLVQQQSDGSYKLYAYCAKNSLQMLDYAGSISNGQGVHSWEDLTVDGFNDVNQRWWFKDLGNGYYRIIPYNAGATGTATLEVTGGPSAGGGASLEIWAYSGVTSQQFQLTGITSPTVLRNSKKGLPTATANLDIAAGKMNCSWIYNWSINRPTDVPAGIEFVPQVWGWYGDTNIGNEVLASAPGCQTVLGYNEPDMSFNNGGSQMDLTSGLTGFQYISALKSHGLRIGGPSGANDLGSWMSSFMSQAVAAPYNYNMDFMGFHDYVGDSTGSGAAYSVLGFCDAVYNQYHKPIWVTEFAPTNLSNSEALIFVRLVCQGFQSRSYVERYSMFTSEAPATSGTGTSALVNADGTLTNVGQLYARM